MFSKSEQKAFDKQYTFELHIRNS